MRVIKYGHACIGIEIKGLTLLVDPGAYNPTPELSKLDAILITHEHQDHVSPDSLRSLVSAHPGVEIITHNGLAKSLEGINAKITYVTDGEALTRKGVTIESFGKMHACIHRDIPLVQNTGFMIDGYLYYPGDAFHVPKKHVEVLALPVAAPWMRIEECIEYAKHIKPKSVFPVHDGMLKDFAIGMTHRIPEMLLAKHDIAFVDMMPGDSKEF